MISVLSENGKSTYNLKEYVVDTQEDIKNLPTSGIQMGSTAFVISTGAVYMLNSSKEWIEV